MSAFGTKKPLSDLELQLSFPTNFQEAYAAYDLPLSYYGGVIRPSVGLPAGKDLQADYHEQKRMDAHRRVMNGVKDTRAATHRALVSHAGYWMMPKAVLGQRVFANPSLGSGGLGGDIYPARRTAPMSGAPFACTANGLQGGVLRSKEGQAFGKRILMNRIAQLNAIDAASAGMDAGAPVDSISDPAFQISQGLPEQAGVGAQVKLTALLQGLVSALATSGGLSRFTFADITEITQLMFRVAPVSNYDELSNLKEAMDDVNEAVEDYKDVLEESPEEFGTDERLARAMVSVLPRLSKYVDAMIDASNLSPKERLAASRAAVASLGLTRYTTGLKAEAPKAAAAVAAVPARNPAAAAPGGGADMGDDFDRGAAPREEAQAAEAQAEAGAAGRPAAAQAAAPPAAGLKTSAEFNALTLKEMIAYMKEKGIQRGSNPINKTTLPGRYAAYLEKQKVGRGRSGGARAVAPRRPAFTEDQRQVFGSSEFNFPYVDELAPSAPQDVPGVTAPRNPLRSRDDIRAAAEYAQAKQRESMAPEGMRPAAPTPAPEAPKVAAGKSKKWIQEATAHMKTGAFTKQASREGKTPAEYAEAVLSHPKKHTETTRKRAQFVKNVAKRPKLINMKGGRHKNAYHQMPDGTYMTGAKHTKYSKPLKVVE